MIAQRASGLEQKAKEPAPDVNPDANPAWQAPEGKRFGQYFNAQRPQNKAGFPKLKHHTSGAIEAMCIAFQVKGECRNGKACRLSHVPYGKLTTEEKDQIGKRLEQVFSA